MGESLLIVVEQFASFVLGLLAGLLTPAAQRRIRRLTGSMRDRKASHLVHLDVRALGFFVLNQWSVARPLLRERISQRVVAIDPDRAQDWCDGPTLARIRAALEDEGGPACTLVDLEIDHRESDRGQQLRLTLSPCLYGDFVAVHDYFRARPGDALRVLERLDEEPVRRMIRTAPPSIMAVNVTVTSSDGFVLAMQRSAAVARWQNEWSLGPYETMILPTGRPGESEDFFGASERCLREEVGLDPGRDYTDVVVSWMGYWVPSALVHVTAHVRSNLTRAALEQRIGASHSAFETERIAWIPDTRSGLAAVIRSYPVDAEGRRWMGSAPIAAQQYWRCRPLLEA